MAFDSKEKSRRDDDIYKAYKKWEKKTTPKGKQLYRRDVIIEFLQNEFYISEYTIDLIITQQRELERNKEAGITQVKMDFDGNNH